jgi:hypothetical protein
MEDAPADGGGGEEGHGGDAAAAPAVKRFGFHIYNPCHPFQSV